MTGTDRLRTLAGAWDEWGIGGTLAEIADQIERELRDERDRWDDDLSEAQVAWNRVSAVMLDMERHCLGHEGMEDSPVARWARELRGALKSDASDGPEAQNPSCADDAETADVTSEGQKVTRGPAEDVSMSAYDLLPADERDAIAWVREHGGLERVRRHWDGYVPAEWLDRVKRSCERKRDRLKGHAWELERKCAERRERIRELERQRSEAVSAHLASDAALYDLRREVRDLCVAHGIEPCDDPLRAIDDARVRPSYRLKRPVLDADGVPIKKGDTVYWLEHTAPFTVVSPHETRDNAGQELECGHTVEVMRDGHELHMYVHPESLHHTKPEPPDSWDALWDDIEDCGVGYESFMRRCRALAERERGE